MSLSRNNARPLVRAITRNLVGTQEDGDPILASFAVGANQPLLLADYTGENYYRDDSGKATRTDFDTLQTFSRASTATYVDSSGALQTAASGVPRRGHHIWDGTAWVNRGVLIESEARTNLAAQSEDFTNPYWDTASTTTVNANQIAAPDGSFADYVEETAVNNNHFVRRGGNIAVTSGATYTLSVFAKKAERNWLSLGVEAAPNDRSWFDIANGVIGTTGSAHVNHTIEDYGNGWYRCSVSYTTVDASIQPYIYINTADNQTVYSGAVGNGLYIWGAQLELGSAPSSYIPTAAATATRAAETLTIPSANLPYNATAMWFTLTGLETYADKDVASQVTLLDWRADANNRITLTLDTDGAKTGTVTLTVVSGGTSWSVSQAGLSPGVNEPFNVALRVTDSDINIAVNGTAATAVATTSIPNLSAVGIDPEGMGTRSLLRIGNGVLTDAELAGATS